MMPNRREQLNNSKVFKGSFYDSPVQGLVYETAVYLRCN